MTTCFLLYIAILVLMMPPIMRDNLVHSQALEHENGLKSTGIPCDKLEHLVFHNHAKLHMISYVNDIIQ